MAEQTNTNDSDDGSSDLRGKLITRLAVAGLLVAALLGVLAFFDYLANPPEDADEPVFTKPVPGAPKKEVSQPVTPAENLPEPPKVEPAPLANEAPPPPVVEAQPAAPVAERPESRPPPASTAAVSKAVPNLPKAVPEATMAPTNILPPRPSIAPEPPPSIRPSARVVEARPAPVSVPPSAPRLFSGFLLQAGVFSSAQRAEELHARLTLSGVPSTLETRVQVGPFRTRQEAEAAQAKLKELGVETILVPPKGKH